MTPLLTRSCALIAWALFLSLYDAWLCFDRSAGFVNARSLSLFASFSMGAVLAVAWPLGLLQDVLRRHSLSRVQPRLLVGALEGAWLAYLLCIRASYATVSLKEKWIVGIGLVVGASLAFAVAPRLPRLAKLASLGLLEGALLLEAYLPFRENSLVHLALDLMAGAGFVALVAPALAALGTQTKMAICAIGAVLVLLAPYTLRASMPVRGLLFDMSSHARVHASVTGSWLSPKHRRHALGAVRCRVRERAPQCTDFRAPEVSALTGNAAGADVLMLTLDAVRADQAQAFPLLWAELRSYVTFTRAVSPASRTSQSFSAMLRGRPLRQAPLPRGNAQRRQALVLSPTLGAALVEQGYRAVTVATHSVLRESSQVARGFEYLEPTGKRKRLRGFGARVAFASAAEAVLAAARETQTPMLAWLHALETHAPYSWDGGTGPLTQVGQLRAAADLDPLLAQLIRDFRAARPGRELVIAVFSDHGEEFGEHGGNFHSSTVYAEQAQVMFALSAPGLPTKSVNAPVSTAAVPATLLSLLGLKTACSFSLPSLLACIERDEACPPLAVSELAPFRNTRRTLTGYTSARHRLLYDGTHHVLRLFDSVQDPGERQDLAQSQRDVLKRLKRQARAWDRQQCVQPAKAEQTAQP